MKNLFLLFTLFFFCTLINAQVGIGTTNPQGALDIVTTNDIGLVIPRVSAVENVTDGQGNPPQNGTIVFDLSRGSTCFYSNDKWLCASLNSQGYPELIDPLPPYSDGSTYIKASNTNANDQFSGAISMSSDGNTLAVGAFRESSNATGVNGSEADNSAGLSGAVYIFTRTGTVWSQQAYIKASNTEANDRFGFSLALSADGDNLAVGAFLESSNATGINGNQSDNSSNQSGAVYVFTRAGAVWSQQAYIKASNTETVDQFGYSVSLNANGNTLAVAAYGEDSNATGINGNETDNSASSAGAVYVFTRSGSTWSQQAYIKASNTEASDRFGNSISLNGDGATLAVGSFYEDSNATGINGNETNNSFNASGAAYIFTRAGSIWSQQAYIKASNTETTDLFASAISVSNDGSTLVVGAHGEDGSSTGINGNQTGNTTAASGAAYVFTRTGSIWSQQAYIKASNTDSNDQFGGEVTLSGDGNTFVSGVIFEASNATGINGNQANNSLVAAGAAYVFKRTGATWSQQAYIKASNTEASDYFGASVALDNDGSTIAIGALLEASNATGIGGDQLNNSTTGAGAVFINNN